MQLGVRDVSQLLRVSEKTIYRWIAKGDLPAYKINDSYRFNRVEILEWATARRINVSHEIFSESADSSEPLPSITTSLETGGIHYRVSGGDKNAVLTSVVNLLPVPEEVDRGFLLKALLMRESLGSTGVGDGIAIPHVRNPIVLHVRKPVLTLCFLESPIDFGAIDGRPVDTLFVIVSNTVRAHLHLLARLGFLLSKTTLREIIRRKAGRDEIMRVVGESEEKMNLDQADRRTLQRSGE